ncbi:MAG: family transposase [Frankiales bacterium]|nr:family transposase [Frankiales bacterium]
MRFIGGVTQQEYVERTREFAPSQCLAVGIDVGKRDALALIADHHGQVVGQPIVFALSEPGARDLEVALDSAVLACEARSVRIGIETAGHYHRPLLSRLASAHDVVELNPAQVKAAREAQGSAKIKTDLRDCAAIVDLVISGMGWRPQQRDAAMTAQLAWTLLRARRVKARTALSNQLLGTLDLVFPGLDGCFDSLLATKIGGVLLHHLLDPDQMLDLGEHGLQQLAAEHDVQLRAPKARQLLGTARDALRLPVGERACRAAVLGTDVALLDAINADIIRAEAELARVLPQTPAAVLLSLPGVATVRASNYGAALGDPLRFTNADQAYRIAGMHPSTYDSAGSTRGGQTLSRRGSPELRAAIIELGKGLAQRDEHFATYRAGLLARRMPPLKANIATGHKAHRLAFSLMRTGNEYDPDRYAGSLSSGGERRQQATGGPVKKYDREAACRHDVTHPPSTTVPRQNSTRKTPLVT